MPNFKLKFFVVFCFLFFAFGHTYATYSISPEILKEYQQILKTVSSKQNHAMTQFEYAIVLSYIGKVEEGAKALNRVRDLDPKFAEHFLSYYQFKSQKDPLNRKLKYRLGFLLYFNRDWDQSLKALSQVVTSSESVDQYSVWAMAYMAVILSEKKDWKSAEEKVREALKYEPDAYALHAALAIALKEQGNVLGALGELTTALQKRGDFEKYEKNLFQ